MTETSEEILISALPKKCTRQPVLTAVLKPKFLSNLTQKDQFTAESVFLSTWHPEKAADIKPEFRFGTGKIYDFSFSCTASATARSPFRFAQADLHFDFCNNSVYQKQLIDIDFYVIGTSDY